MNVSKSYKWKKYIKKRNKNYIIILKKINKYSFYNISVSIYNKLSFPPYFFFLKNKIIKIYK